MLITQRLRFRRFTPADLVLLHQEIYSHAKVAEALSQTGFLSIGNTKSILTRRLQHWQDHGFGVWALIHPQTQQLLGHCGLHYLDGMREVELTYTIHPNYWRQGLATEAATAVLAWGFEQLNLPQIAAVTGPTNQASQRVMQKLGMHYVKTMQYNGTEVLYYRLSREEFRRSHPQPDPAELDLLITSL
jgi:ribosomal-protein-alanine N-acetyltransferase